MAGPAVPPSQQPRDAFWQPVAHTRNAFHVYSAFMELRQNQPASVKLIGATARFNTDLVFCRLWPPNSRIPYILQAKIELISEHHNLHNTAVFVLCLLGSLMPEDVMNGSIALVSHAEPAQLATNLFKIMNTTPEKRSKPNLHVCVRPLFGFMNDVKWMVEWIELNRMLGVTHFYFYNMSMGDQLDCMFRKYLNQEKLFTILPFPPFPQYVWAEGQMVSSHDCLHRSMSRADWLLLIDTDELVLPHIAAIRPLQHSSDLYSKPLLAMFNMFIQDSEKENIFAFEFRNALFYLSYEDDPESQVPLTTSRKTRRLQLVNWYGTRSKYAVRPTKAIELGIHEVEEFVTGKRDSVTVYLSSEIALLHHYRNECVDGEFVCREEKLSTIDRTAHVWTKRLWKRVQKRLAEVNQYCPPK